MSDLTEKLAEAGVPSERAVQAWGWRFDVDIAATNDPNAATAAGIVSAIAADAPAILRVLLEARLAEMGEVEMAMLAWELGNTSGAPTLQATLLRLLAPEARPTSEEGASDYLAFTRETNVAVADTLRLGELTCVTCERSASVAGMGWLIGSEFYCRACGLPEGVRLACETPATAQADGDGS